MQILDLIGLICASFALGFSICTLMAIRKIDKMFTIYEGKTKTLEKITRSIKDDTERKKN